MEETVRISYLLSNIDRLITYKAVADKAETMVDLKSFLILRNFSGEDFDRARVLLDYGEAFERGIAHEETKQLLFLKNPKITMGSSARISVKIKRTNKAAEKPNIPRITGESQP